MSLIDRLHALDRLQQNHRQLSFPAAVIKKFGDDGAGQLAALIAYYGFASLFPLLLLLVTVLGFVLEGDPKTQASILHSALGQFPIIGNQLESNIHSLKGSIGALLIGLLGLLLGGLGIVGVTQSAFQQVWHIPRKSRPNFLTWRLRGLGLLGVLGILLIVSTVAAGYVSAQTAGLAAAIGGVLLAFAFNLLLFFAAFKFLSPEEIPTRDILPGVLFAAILWQILQHIGGYYVSHVVRHAQETSGLFAFVLGLLAWLYLGGQVTLIAAEINVVRARRLWPRSFFSQPLLDADKRALTSSAETEERVEEENVEVNFDGPPG
jgi:YihY family inner membrane protein